jgi:hypothetical protein
MSPLGSDVLDGVARKVVSIAAAALILTLAGCSGTAPSEPPAPTTESASADGPTYGALRAAGHYLFTDAAGIPLAVTPIRGAVGKPRRRARFRDRRRVVSGSFRIIERLRMTSICCVLRVVR